ncbi:hypothetical protein SAMN06893096_104422 [Geodermatophilus pulveris]|uniref:Endonuclease/exonuclease/phosphatase domain-containing protein n=1 Tax=Geodermatophilus pulveris TaxID=1564159 RepID=A0A239F203_9ACTN|nr:ExeM/NucH family extracellular endonuclease [Geodermatophilus pulveris]SNS50857.1 hypothetical protein SAMN06893096_104422 [Geodermatophilus pulveris]
MFSPSGRPGLPAARAAVGLTAASLAVVGLPAVAAAAPATPYISEVHYDDAGDDTGEFVEVTLPPGTSSEGLAVVRHDGNGSLPYETPAAPALPVVTAPADAPAAVVVDHPADGLQNGAPDGLALVRGTEVLEFLSYEGGITAAGGPAQGLTSTDIGASEDGVPEGQSLSRAFASAEDPVGAWALGPSSAGAVDSGGTTLPSDPEPEGTCEVAPTHEIGAVQGTGATTPLTGEEVTVRGVVVGDVPGFSGFHLQDPDGDGAADTSDGVFVFSPVAVDLGDTVAVTGQATEFGGQTQVTSREDVAVCADGTAEDLPDAAALDLPADDATRERLEGMLVEPADALTVSEVFDLTSSGELTLSEGGLLVQPTELARPGTPEAARVVEENALRRITLDDGRSARVSVTTRPYLSPTTPVRVGDELTSTEPLVLGYGFSAWRLQPADGTAEGVFAPQDTRPAAPDEVGGDVQVGAFNVLNYFLTRGAPGRGARTDAEFEEQAGKIVPAIQGLGADVVTLMEIEDTDSTGLTPGNADTALADLVRRLNAGPGPDVWSSVPLPDELYAVDRDVIRNAVVYRNDVVQPVGDPVGLVDEEAFDNAREPQAQTFTKDGDAFTVIANHLKSKSPGNPPPPAGDPNADTGDGQGAFNADRVAQARSLAAFAEGLRGTEPDVVVMGDLNAYTREDSIEVLREAGYTDLGELLDPGRYSYVFNDVSGSLDHAMATAELTAKVTDLVHWNTNSVESRAYQYDGDPALYAPTPYRSSDHDPIVFGIDLAERCDGLVPTLVGTPGDDVLRGGNGAGTTEQEGPAS